MSKSEEFTTSIRERAKVMREEWAAGLVSIGGEGIFAGINDPELGESYLDAARDLLDRNRERLLQFALPIFFLQRHALELALKQVIGTVLAHDHITGRRPGKPPQPDRTHDLLKLLAELKRAVGTPSRDLAKLPGLVDRFHAQDEAGTWARYRSGNDPIDLDLGGAQRDLDDLYEHMFAHPTAGEGELGWVIEYGYLINEFLTRDGFGPGES